MAKESKMTNLEAHNEVAGAIRRAKYVDSDYADSVDVRALKVCERVLHELLEQDAIKGKAVYREGERITSLDELAKQEFIYVRGKLTHCGLFMSWQFRMTMQYIERGCLRYAVKAKTKEDSNERS